MFLLSIGLASMDQAHAVGGLRRDHGLIVQEYSTTKRVPIPEIFLDHGKHQVLVLDRRVLWIMIMLLIEATASFHHRCDD